MGLFDDVLGQGESLIRIDEALDYEFLPKILPFREKEQRHLANSIKPLFQNRSGNHLLIHGAPGIGKTAATRAVLRDLEEQSEEINVVYINCWKHNTTYKVLAEITDQLGYAFTQNKSSSELSKVISSICNKSAAVFVFDEIDKAEDFDFLYTILEEVYKKAIFLITNFKSWMLELDERIKSRMTPELLEFKGYNSNEIKEILNQRSKIAFVPNVWENDAFELIVNKAALTDDVRTGIYLLKQAALKAEDASSKKITLDHAKKAIIQLDEFTIKKSSNLDEESTKILDLIKANSGKKIGDLYRQYQKEGGNVSYKTFQRRIAFLDEGKFITLEKQTGQGGNTTIVNKKLTDY